MRNRSIHEEIQGVVKGLGAQKHVKTECSVWRRLGMVGPNHSFQVHEGILLGRGNWFISY